jgi:hypothetical protein
LLFGLVDGCGGSRPGQPGLPDAAARASIGGVVCGRLRKAHWWWWWQQVKVTLGERQRWPAVDDAGIGSRMVQCPHPRPHA